MSLPENYKEILLEKLKEKKIKPNCEYCGHNNWTVVAQAISIQTSDLSGKFRLPPPQIPSAGLICNNCGNIRTFALGVLGIKFNKGDKDESR